MNHNEQDHQTIDFAGYRCRIGKRTQGLPTAKQAQVMAGIAAGMTQKEIARLRGISPATVKSTVEGLYFTLHAQRATAAVAEAMRRGWISPICVLLMALTLYGGSQQQAMRVRPTRQPTARTVSAARREVSA